MRDHLPAPGLGLSTPSAGRDRIAAIFLIALQFKTGSRGCVRARGKRHDLFAGSLRTLSHNEGARNDISLTVFDGDCKTELTPCWIVTNRVKSRFEASLRKPERYLSSKLIPVGECERDLEIAGSSHEVSATNWAAELNLARCSRLFVPIQLLALKGSKITQDSGRPLRRSAGAQQDMGISPLSTAIMCAEMHPDSPFAGGTSQRDNLWTYAIIRQTERGAGADLFAVRKRKGDLRLADTGD